MVSLAVNLIRRLRNICASAPLIGWVILACLLAGGLALITTRASSASSKRTVSGFAPSLDVAIANTPCIAIVPPARVYLPLVQGGASAPLDNHSPTAINCHA